MKKALIAGLVILGSCKSTESINRFAKSASTGTAEISSAIPGFNQICRQYDPAALKKLTDTGIYGTAVRPSVHCPEFKKADSLTDLINQTLVNYFSLLASVSDRKLLAYNARDLVNALQTIQTQVYPQLALTEEKVSAVRGLLNTILNEPIKWYRYNKLINTMKQNDTALERVISAYVFILDTALNGEITQAIANYTSFVYMPLYTRSASPVEKVFVNLQYQQFLISMETEREKIKKARRLFILIQKDHHMLAFGKPPAGFAYTEAEISQDIILINKLITELITLIK